MADTPDSNLVAEIRQMRDNGRGSVVVLDGDGGDG
tara:strand:+ start:21318 stop:21422 length:105 start_codon:yes stop_codon:yes gene_type:complete